MLFWIVPALFIVIAIPLILQRVPRNRLYGFRTPRTLASDEIWYPANRVAGIALATAGVLWLAMALVVSRETGTVSSMAQSFVK